MYYIVRSIFCFVHFLVIYLCYFNKFFLCITDIMNYFSEYVRKDCLFQER